MKQKKVFRRDALTSTIQIIIIMDKICIYYVFETKVKTRF